MFSFSIKYRISTKVKNSLSEWENCYSFEMQQLSANSGLLIYSILPTVLKIIVFAISSKY